MAPPSHDLTPTWQVRITACDGTVVGGGVIAPDRQIVTCKHVVDAALRRSGGPPAAASPPVPEHPVRVDMPYYAPGWRTTARVIAETWDAERDITLLRLDDAPPHPEPRFIARMEQIAASGRPRRVRVMGYPRLTPAGQTAEAFAVRPGGDSPGRAQLQIDPSTPVIFEPGYSGCGVQDAEDGSVIGILTSTLEDATSRSGRIGYMEPVEQVAPIAGHVAVSRPVVFDDKLAAARRILTDLSFDAVEEAFDATEREMDRSLLVPVPRQRFTTAWDAFVHLAEFATHPDQPTHEARFVEEIARQEVGIARTLRDYTDSRPESEISRAARELIRNGPPARADRTPSLFIVAEPADVGTDLPDPPQRYRLRNSLVDGYGAARPGESVYTSVPGLRDAVLKLVDDAERNLRHQGALGLRLEFFLPFPLLMQPLSHWSQSSQAPLTGEGTKIGASYEIVLHFRDRFTEGWDATYNRLIARWNGMEEAGGGTLYRIPADSDGDLKNRLQADDIVGCVLGAPPGTPEGTRQLGSVLEAGLPVVMWISCEDGETARRFQDRIQAITAERDIITAGDIRSLATRLRGWRTNSRGSKIEVDGCDPYDIAIIVDDMSELTEFPQNGILVSPRTSEPGEHSGHPVDY